MMVRFPELKNFWDSSTETLMHQNTHYQIPAIYAPIKDSTVVVQANNYIVFDIIDPAGDTHQI